MNPGETHAGGVRGEIGGSATAPARRGGCASKKRVRSIRSGADGVVVQVQEHFRLILNHHPVRSIKGSFAIFFLMSRPPLLARRGDPPNASPQLANELPTQDTCFYQAINRGQTGRSPFFKKMVNDRSGPDLTLPLW